jgi:hypothetical protein
LYVNAKLTCRIFLDILLLWVCEWLEYCLYSNEEAVSVAEIEMNDVWGDNVFCSFFFYSMANLSLSWLIRYVHILKCYWISMIPLNVINDRLYDKCEQ